MVDGSFKFTAALVCSTTQLLFGKHKPPLHQVEPGSAGGGEVYLEARSLGPYEGIISTNEVHMPQARNSTERAVTLVAAGHHFAGSGR